MSLMIESTDELLQLLKKMDLKVRSVDELYQLLASINANYNPDAARQKTAKLIGTAVPGAMAAAAAFATFFLLGSNNTVSALPFTVGGLAVVWGAVAVVSTAAVICASIMTRGRRGQMMQENPSGRPVSRGEPMMTHITKDLSV
ncbi:MAG TPA: hypothetical protein VH592_23035 [Gemmataceae bacterium]|jgi:hypothetical protein